MLIDFASSNDRNNFAHYQTQNMQKSNTFSSRMPYCNDRENTEINQSGKKTFIQID